jgi:hypothetical protein
MATFFGFLLFAPLMALFFGFLLWFIPAMMFPDQVSRRRPRTFGYLVTGYGLLAILSLYLLISSGGGHDVAPLLGTALSFALVVFIRARRRAGRPNAWRDAPWRRRWASKFGFDPNEPTDPGGGPDDGETRAPDPRGGRYPRAQPPPRRPADDYDTFPDTDPS